MLSTGTELVTGWNIPVRKDIEKGCKELCGKGCEWHSELGRKMA